MRLDLFALIYTLFAVCFASSHAPYTRSGLGHDFREGKDVRNSVRDGGPASIANSVLQEARRVVSRRVCVCV
uniref:Putative secreted protein n=1 Tax=Anopheles darlingi TaxID=43151 RepID=A0A2M4D2G1_ANODA